VIEKSSRSTFSPSPSLA